MHPADRPHPDHDESVDKTTSRRAFVKTGVTLTSGIVLSGVYAKPRIQSIDLGILPNPSSGGSLGNSGDPGNSGGNRNKPKKEKNK